MSAESHCGEALVARCSDIVPRGDGKVRRPVGCRVVRVDPCSGVIRDLVVNQGKEAGPGTKEGNCSIEQPVDCRFNCDGLGPHPGSTALVAGSGGGRRLLR